MKKTISLLLALAMTVSLLAACGSDARPEEPAANDGVQAVENVPSGAEDAPGGDKNAVFVGGWPYSTVPSGHFNMFISNAIELKFYRELHQLALATYTAEDDAYHALLAESWESNADNTAFNVKLREDVA